MTEDVIIMSVNKKFSKLDGLTNAQNVHYMYTQLHAMY